MNGTVDEWNRGQPVPVQERPSHGADLSRVLLFRLFLREAYLESLEKDNLPIPFAVEPEIASVRVRG